MPTEVPNGTVVLLMDLQKDFLAEAGRMPVDRSSVLPIVDAANAVLSRTVSKEIHPVLIVNEFPVSDRIGNFFRRGAAVEGTAGADLDPRITADAATPKFSKTKSSAFSNPELNSFLKGRGTTHLCLLGVFAEGCIRATALDALRLGYAVTVVEEAVASNTSWKKRFALWVMRRRGVRVIPCLRELERM